MSKISAEITPKLIKDNKLEVRCRYGNDGACEAQNQKALRPFHSVKGMPSLSEPLSVNNLMLVTGNHPIGEGQAIIIPTGVCLAFDLAFLSKLGYRIAISLPDTGEVVCESAFFWRTVALETADYLKGSIGTWDDGSVLKSDDPRFGGDAASGYAANTFRIQIEATPLKTLTLESLGSASKIRATFGDERISMIIEVLVMDEEHYRSSNISLASPARLGD